MPASMKMIFTDAGPLNRWGTPARTNTSVTNSRAVKRRASHRMNALQAGNSGNHTSSDSGGSKPHSGGGNPPKPTPTPPPTPTPLTPCQQKQEQYKNDLNGASTAWYSFLKCVKNNMTPQPSDDFINDVYASAGLISKEKWDNLAHLNFTGDLPVSKNLPSGICTPPSLQGTKEEIRKKYSAQTNNDILFNTVGYFTALYHLLIGNNEGYFTASYNLFIGHSDLKKCESANNMPDIITINNKEYVFASHAVATLIGDFVSGIFGNPNSDMPTFKSKVETLNWVDDDYILLPSQ